MLHKRQGEQTVEVAARNRDRDGINHIEMPIDVGPDSVKLSQLGLAKLSVESEDDGLLSVPRRFGEALGDESVGARLGQALGEGRACDKGTEQSQAEPVDFMWFCLVGS